jgi:hypothetical protein
MQLTAVDITLWVTTFLANACLLSVLFYRRRYRIFPWFTLLVAGDLVQSVILAVIVKYGGHGLYFYTYWVFAVFDSIVQIVVLAELTRNILRQFDRDSPLIKSFGYPLIVLLVFAAFSVWRFTPDMNHPLTNTAFKVTMFSDVILVGLTSVTFFTVFFGGLRFRVHAAVITFGLIIYGAGKLVVFAAVLGLGSAELWSIFEQGLKPLYILCLIFWIASLWLDEPSRKLTAEMEGLLDWSRRLERAIEVVKQRRGSIAK